jgi:CHASE2 domain-containing sensor protein
MSQPLPPDSDPQQPNTEPSIDQKSENSTMDGGQQAAQGNSNIQNQGNHNWFGDTWNIICFGQQEANTGRQAAQPENQQLSPKVTTDSKENDRHQTSRLSVICQNLGVGLLTLLSRHKLYSPLIANVAITLLLLGGRSLGILEVWELKAYDQLLRLRPPELPDQRLLVVTITEADVKAQDQNENRGSSLSDAALAQLLEKLEQYKPRVIGLDIYRDFDVGSKYGDLKTRLQQKDNFIAVCQVGGTDNQQSIKPPPEVPRERLGFSDIRRDRDNILRRHLLGLAPGDSSCDTSNAFSLLVALRYLEAEKKDIETKLTSEGYLQIGKVVFKTLENDSGGYYQLDAKGHQVLLNYRSSSNVAEQVTLADVLNGKLTPRLVEDRIVLIGTTDKTFRDYWPTPSDPEMPGVLVQAHMVSQILSAVLDGRPLIGYWPKWGEAYWIWGWSLVGGLLAWHLRSRLSLILAVGTSAGVLYVVCFAFLIRGIWVPLIPSALALVATGGSVVVYAASQKRRSQ